jgi:hypothetical protein
VSYFDGDFREWQDIRDYYSCNEAQILASFKGEFELIGDPIDRPE